MKRTILEIYAMTVCFVAVMVFGGYACSAVYHAAQYIMPRVLMSQYDYTRYISNEAFCNSGYNTCFDNSIDESKPKVRLSEEVITKKREGGQAAAIDGVQHEAVVSLVWALIFIPISIIVFLIHWGLGRKARS